MSALNRPAVPPAPSFGEALPTRPSADVLGFLAHRRSASALTLGKPGPSAKERTEILRLAARVPDHGKLSPWRFVILEGEGKAFFVNELEDIAGRRPDAVRARTALAKIAVPPLSVGVISRVTEGEIPEWEQRLSAGAVAMLLLIAASAMGYGANWITDWYAYDKEGGALLGLAQGERVAGFVHIGTPTQPPHERVRPDVRSLTSVWRPA